MSRWTFIDHVTDYLMRPRMGDSKEPTYYPSEATSLYVDAAGATQVAGKCRRAVFFRHVVETTKYDPDNWGHMQPLADMLIRKEVKPDRYLQWIWDAGNMYEEHIINYAKSAGVFIGTQVPVYVKSHKISGKVDLIVVNPENGKLCIVETKSIYGHAIDKVLGKKTTDRKTGKPIIEYGVPRDSNLMQIAIYQWWYGLPRSDFEHARLVYGARDTGVYGEFLVRVSVDPVTANMPIEYKQLLPYESDWIDSGLTINSILKDGFEYVQNHLDTGQIPSRDFEAQYDQAKIDALYAAEELSKADTEKYEKLKVITYRQRLLDGDQLTTEEQALVNQYDGKRIKIDQKPIEKGDWQCRFCQWRDVCYDQDGVPRDL
jgi:hypothetical protein